MERHGLVADTDSHVQQIGAIRVKRADDEQHQGHESERNRHATARRDGSFVPREQLENGGWYQRETNTHDPRKVR